MADGFLGPAGALANIIGFGAPVAQTTGTLMQNAQNVRDYNANAQQFTSMINSLGPDYAWAQNWLKQAGPGAIPSVTAALGGPKEVGDMIRRQQEMEALKPYLDDPNTSPEQLARQIYEKTGDATLLEDLWKSEFRVSSRNPPLTVPQMVKAIDAGIKTAPENIRGYLQLAVNAGNADPDGSKGLVMEAYKLLYPSLEASYAQQLVPNQLLGHDIYGNAVYGPVTYGKTGSAPGVPRGFITPPGLGGGTGTAGGGTAGVTVPPPAAAPSPGEEETPGPGAAATPAPSASERLSSALGALGAGILGAGAGEPGALTSPFATPTETPEEAMTPGAAPSEEEATPAATGLPPRVPTAVPSPTELAMGAPTPTPDTSEPGIPVSVGGAGTPTPLPTVGEPPGPISTRRIPKTILSGTPTAAPTPRVTYGVSKPDAKTLNIGQNAQRAYVSLLGFKKVFSQFTPDEWDRSTTLRWADYEKRKLAGKSTGDPRLDHLIGQAITVEKQSQAALSAAMGTSSYKMQLDAHGHIPRAGDDYNIIQSDLDNLLAADGPYVQAMKDAGIPVPGGEPTPYVLPPPAGAATPGAGAQGIDRRNNEVLHWRP